MADGSRTLNLKTDPGHALMLTILLNKEEQPSQGLESDYRGCRQLDFLGIPEAFKNPERLSELMDFGLVNHIRLPSGELANRYELTDDGRRDILRFNRQLDAAMPKPVPAKAPAASSSPAKPPRGIVYTPTDPKKTKGGKPASVAAKRSGDRPID